MDKTILANYEVAKKIYARYGVDTDKVLAEFAQIPVSLQCWAGDDVKGFEGLGPVASENVVTGSYPYIARNGGELRSDIDEAFRFSPLKHKVNLHSMYAEYHHPRNDLTIEDFREWVDWAKAKGYGLDFNTSFFT
ncbi:MAG: L-rhamnose isomerase, partial [Bacilli bacterium]